MDTDVRKQICRLIAGLVVADDELDATEDAFVNAMLLRFGLTTEDRAALFPVVDAEEARETFASLPAADREQAFGWLVEAAAADKRFTDEERDYLHRVGAGMGLSGKEIDDRVAAAGGK